MKRPELDFFCLDFEALDLRQLYQIMALRQSVFSVEQQCAYLDADGNDYESRHLLGVHPDGRIWAYARLLPPNLVYPGYASIGRVVTDQAARRYGYGKELMKHALENLENWLGKTPVKISAQAYLVRFYASFGFKTIGAEYLEDNIPHIAMVYDPEAGE